jgi:hypothetical protein
VKALFDFDFNLDGSLKRKRSSAVWMVGEAPAAEETEETEETEEAKEAEGTKELMFVIGLRQWSALIHSSVLPGGSVEAKATVLF